jgi:hypothetical protein
MLGKRARPVRAGGRWKRTRACGHLADGLPVLRHGHVPGRDFRLRLDATPATLRIDVTDTRTERRPCRNQDLQLPSSDEESGRGLLLVDALAADWGVTPRTTAPGKTVWAVLDVP